jgi:hypothetical protein
MNIHGADPSDHGASSRSGKEGMKISGPLELQLRQDEAAAMEIIERLRSKLSEARGRLRTVQDYMVQKGIEPSPLMTIRPPSDRGDEGRDVRGVSGTAVNGRVSNSQVLNQAASILKDSSPNRPMTLSQLYAEMKRRAKAGQSIGGVRVQLPGKGTEGNLAVHLDPNYPPLRRSGRVSPIVKENGKYRLNSERMGTPAQAARGVVDPDTPV